MPLVIAIAAVSVVLLAAGAWFFLDRAGITLADIFKTGPAAEESALAGDEMSKKEVKDFLIEADGKKNSIRYEMKEDIIGRCDNRAVFRISGDYADFQNAARLLKPYFTAEMAAVELYKINLCVLGDEVGALQEGSGYIPVTDRSEFTLLEDEPALKRVQVRSKDEQGREGLVEYTLEKGPEGRWLITGSSADGPGERIKYIVGWQVRASSYLSETFQGKKLNHYPERAFDSRMETAWVEGAKGDGTGEQISLRSDTGRAVSGIELVNGYAKSKETYYNNNRVKKILVELSDGSSFTGELVDNSQELQAVDFGREVKTSSLTITLLEVYPGDKYKDTCISEIKIYQRF